MTSKQLSNISFFTHAQQNPYIDQVNLVIQQCRGALSVIEDEGVKRRLETIILLSLNILSATAQHEIDQEEIVHICNQLQREASALPTQFQQKSSLASLSYTIAMACVFALALSVSFSLGFAFHAGSFFLWLI